MLCFCVDTFGYTRGSYTPAESSAQARDRPYMYTCTRETPPPQKRSPNEGSTSEVVSGHKVSSGNFV
eukprot:2678340-Pyramimonas_sp.AAC.2